MGQASVVSNCVLLSLLSALGGCQPDRGAPLRLRVDTVRALGCAPSAPLESFVLDALGPGPFEPARRQRWNWGEQPADVPADTRWIRLSASDGAGWEGLAAARVEAPGADEPEIPLLLSPPLMSCPLADPALARPEASAVALDEEGTLWIAGGLNGETGRRRLVRLAAGRRLADTTGRLALRRADAAAVAHDGTLWVSGGWPARGSLAHDTVERIDAARTTTLLQPPLLTPRAEHTALRFPDGSLLLVGGRAGSEEPLLERAEHWAPQRAARLVDQPEGRLRPSLRLDASGTVWAAGGTDAAGEPLGGLWRLDAGSDAFVVAADLPPLRDGTLLALGTRSMSWVGLAPGEGTVRVLSLHPREGGTVDMDTWSPPLPSLRRLHAVSLPGGRLLLLGLTTDGRRGAWWLQPAWRLVAPAESSRNASVLRIDPTGAIWELGPAGASLRRAPTLLPQEPSNASWLPARPPTDPWVPTELLWLDRSDWFLDAGIPEARTAGAALEVAALSFQHFETELTTRGALRLVLLATGGAEASVRAERGTLRLAGCRLPFDEAAPVRWRLRREDARIHLSVEGREPSRCQEPREIVGLDVHLRIEALAPGTRLLSWRGRRL